MRSRLWQGSFTDLWCKVSTTLLAFSWFLGLSLGILFANSASDILVPMMRRAMESSVSIPGLLASAFLPFLVSALAISYCRPLLLIICSSKAFSFGFCSYGVGLVFGQGSWLARFLFLFSDCCLIPVLYFYWLRNISGSKASLHWELMVCIGLATIVGCLDICLISPFWAKLI